MWLFLVWCQEITFPSLKKVVVLCHCCSELGASFLLPVDFRSHLITYDLFVYPRVSLTTRGLRPPHELDIPVLTVCQLTVSVHHQFVALRLMKVLLLVRLVCRNRLPLWRSCRKWFHFSIVLLSIVSRGYSGNLVTSFQRAHYPGFDLHFAIEILLRVNFPMVGLDGADIKRKENRHAPM